MRRATIGKGKRGKVTDISIHALLAESDKINPTSQPNLSNISIHALLAESDWSSRQVTVHTWKFLSTLSLRRATYINKNLASSVKISIHALLAESDHEQAPYIVWETHISIHALLAESDANWFDLWGWAEYFYPRSPCGERPFDKSKKSKMEKYFYPRSPCGERPLFSYFIIVYVKISIHALLAESDQPATSRNNKNNIFLSTLSLRRATNTPIKAYNIIKISIHALLAESDPPVREIIQWEGIFLSTLSLRRATINPANQTNLPGYFYPRSPCGERRPIDVPQYQILDISIHALLAESDSAKSTPEEAKRYFYPRSPCGERPDKSNKLAGRKLVFLSTLSLRRATINGLRHKCASFYFYPRSPCGERPSSQSSAKSTPEISIHALLAESDILGNAEAASRT